MGIYDRDYYRADERAGLWAGQSVIVQLIIANVVVFVADMLLGDPSQNRHPVAQWLMIDSDFEKHPWQIIKPN